MALTSRLAVEIDGRNAEQQALAVRKALESLTEAGLRVGPVLSAAFGNLADAAKNANAAANGLNSARKALDGVNEAGKKTGAIIGGAAGSVSTIGNNAAAAEAKLAAARKALEALNQAGGKSSSALNGAGGAMASASVNARSATTQVQGLERQVKSLAAQAAGLAGPLAAAFSIKAFYDAAEAYSTLTNRMKLVTSGAQELATAQSAVFSIAQSSYQPLNATAELYQRIATNQKELGLSGKEVAGVVGTISKTLAISGASASAASAALVQLGQAFASGTLRGEELNSVMEQAPALAQAIAAGMGKTVGELRTLGAAGLLTADAVVKALQAQQGAVDELFGKTAVTIGNSLTAAGNSFTQFVGRMDQASGASAAISAQIVAVSQAIDSLTSDSDALNTTINAVGAAMSAAAAGGAFLLVNKLGALLYAYTANRAAGIASAAATLNSAKSDAIKAATATSLAKAEMDLYRGTVLQTVAAGRYAEARLKQAAADSAATVAADRLAMAQRTVFASLMGPAGIALAVGTVAASLFLMRDNTSAATSALDEHGLSVQEVSKKYNELNGAQQRLKRLEWIDQQKQSLKEAGSALDEYAYKVETGVKLGPLTEQFRTLIQEVKDGQRNLDSVTTWVESQTKLYPEFGKELAQLTAKYDDNIERNNELKSVLSATDVEQKKVAASAAVNATAQSESGKQTKAQAAEIEKYLAKLREQSVLFGANKKAIAEYEASKLGMNTQQKEEARVLGSILDVQEEYREALKKNDKARQESLRVELTALITQRNAAEDAATKSTEAINRIHYASDKALGESVSRRIQELAKLATFASSLPGNVNYLTGKGIERPTIQGSSMVPIGAPKPANSSTSSTSTRKTVQQETDELLAQIRETSEARTKAAKAYTESAGQKMLDQASQQNALLKEQAALVGLQKGELDKIGPAQRELIKWEQQLADIKEKKTLTADQKSLLANEEKITAALKINAAVEKETALRKLAADEAEKLLSFQKSINNELDLAQEELSNQLAGLGMGQEGRKRLQDDLKIRQDYQKKMSALQEQLNEGRLTKETYDKETALLQNALDKRLDMQTDYYRQLELAQGNWANGANAAWQDYVDEARDISNQTYDLFSNAFHGMEDSLVDFVTSGKLSFKELADSIIADIARILIRTKIVTPALNALFGGAGAGGGAASLLSGGGSSGGGFDLQGAWNNVSGAYSVATSGFGQAVSAGWASGEGFLGGVQGAFKAGAGQLSTSIGSLFTSSSGSMVNGVYQLGSSGSVATVDLISNTVTNSATGAVTGTASGATSAAGAGLSASSALMAGIGGAIQGYLKAGVKGAVAGAGGAVAGAYAGAALGSMVPVIGTAIGGAIGAVIGGWFGSSLFGGDWVTKDQGFQLGVTDGDLDAYAFEYQKKKGGLFSSNKKRTRLTALDPEMQAALDGTYASTLGTVIGLFDSLNVELNDGVLDGLNMAKTQISTKDKTAEEIQAEIATWFTSLADAAVGTIAQATNELSLSGYSFDQLTLSANTLLQLNAILEKTNNGMLAVSVGGLHLAERLAELGGGMERFSELTSGYYNAFIPSAERADDTLIDVGRQFEAMNIAFPATREGFRTLVEAMDVTTLSGQDAYVSLMNLAAGADAAYTILEDRATAAAQAAADAAQALFDKMVGAAGTAQSAVQRAIAAEQEKATADYNKRVTELNNMSSAASKSVSDLTSISSSLSNALKALRGDSDDAVKMLQAQARATLQSALATARSGGSLAGFTGLEDALSTVSSNNTDLYGSMEDFARDQGRTANVVAELNALNGKQLTTAEKTVKALQDQLDQAKAAYDAQMAQYDAQLEFAQAQMDALNGVDNSVMTVTEAIKQMNAAVVAAIATINGKSTTANAGTLIDTIYKDVLGRDADDKGKEYWQGQLANGSLNNGNIVGAITNAAAQDAIKNAYSSVLGRGADAAGAKYWSDQVASGALTVSQLEQAIRNAAKASGSIPAFASGGMHSGGIRLVGEKGPEIELTGPSRIISNKDAAKALSGAGGQEQVVAELQALKSYLYMITKYGEQTASGIRRQNEVGIPMQEVA
jgi:lambda family phage tail tape measure protein